MKQLDTFERAAVEQAVKDLFGAKHFSICTLDYIGEVMGVNPASHRNYKALRALHCVDYADMSPEIISELQTRVAECLRPTFNPVLFTRALLLEGSDVADIGAEDTPLRISQG